MTTQTLAALLPLVVAFSTTFLLVPQVRRFAVEWKLGDKPNGRKLHAQAIPHLGGVAIFAGFFLALLVQLATPMGMPHAVRILALLPGLLVVFGLGLVDDLRGLRAGIKLTYQFVGAVCVVAMGAGLWRGPLSDPVFVFSVALSVLWYVGVCNSVNLIDGLDGLAAGIAVIAAVSFLVVGVELHDGAVMVVSLGLIGSLLAFLRFNFHPALIFMGDTGSMFVGFTLAFLACLLAPVVGSWHALLGGATVLGVPILDTATAICRRLLTRQHIFRADGEHIHHKLLRLGLSHRRAVLVLYGSQLVLAVMGAGILLGHFRLFPLAATLGIGFSLGIMVWSRRRMSRHALQPGAGAFAARGRLSTEEVSRTPRPAPSRSPSSLPVARSEVYAEVPPTPPARRS